MRRALFLTAFAALVAVVPAAADLRPVVRQTGETRAPRVRPGVIRIPAGQASGRVRVVTTLGLPPLAAARGRGLFAAGDARKLDTASASSRAYLQRVDAAQRAAIAQLHTAIPEARVQERFRVVLDGITVELPATRLPKLLRQRWLDRVYPSVRYALATNHSPAIIGADVLQGLGVKGDGVKIGIVDDGVDQRNPFLNPAGYSFPAGFPRGGLRWTSPKVIVARTFPGPNAGRPGRLAVDPAASFHGTHVAGIAAGDEGTNAPAGRDHPAVSGLHGVAPRAWLGNYRVFTVPTPIGHVANTPEIIAAFESAVQDGMDVINFSGGGPETDPVNDAMIETVHNVVQAGVVPVIAAGNDRNEYGLGSVGSPGTAPDAISVAAVTDTHVFSPSLSVADAGAPAALQRLPFAFTGGVKVPVAWASVSQTLVDVGSITGTNGQPVERHLCGPAGNLASTAGTLPARSLRGAIALASRGLCPFVTKAEQARRAGAIGLVLVDNRFGEPTTVPIELELPGGMISDLDGARLRDYMASHGGRATIRVAREIDEIETGRSGIVTYFSSAGPTDFRHALKPDVSAPGGQILSSTLPEFAGSSFAVFDGTSMATPHVAGAAGLLVELHRGWTPQQVKSALVSTAGPAWANTARTLEAPVTLQGGGLVALTRARDPLVFTDPVSLSFGLLDVTRRDQSEARLVRITDAGGGAGLWSVELQPQSASDGATLSLPPAIEVAPGGEADLVVKVRAAGGAASGDDFGFVVLRRGETTRRIPYDFSVTRPGLRGHQPLPLKKRQKGDTRSGVSLADRYRYPDNPFGNGPDQPPMREDGAEKVYVKRLNNPAVNFGVAVELETPGARIDPWILGSLDENDVQGYAATPVDVNELTYDFRAVIGAAATVFPRQQELFVSVDSGRDEFSDRRLAGRYVLRSWVNDVKPPTLTLLTKRVAAGRPILVVRATDGGAGVDPLSLTIGYDRILVGAAEYDPVSGIAAFPLPAGAPALRPGTTRGAVLASDFQEAKNVSTTGADIMPNTRFKTIRIRVVTGTTVQWLTPASGVCAGKPERLVVAAGSTRTVRAVRFFDGAKPIGVDRSGSGLAAVSWRTKGARAGVHVLHAVVEDGSGRRTAAARNVRVCR